MPVRQCCLTLGSCPRPEVRYDGDETNMPKQQPTTPTECARHTSLQLGAQAEWAKRVGFRPSVAVNLSAHQLGDVELPGPVAEVVTRWHAPAESLWLEVTETAFAEETGSRVLFALHDLGTRLAIDDFGTGWSSMARLASFPWDLLKIDQSFVQALGKADPHAEQVLISTIALAHALGIPTTAAGVETHEQLHRLAEFGCDIVQGYLFARPSAAQDAITHVASDGLWTAQGSLIEHGVIS
jgi:EAL domain-containing protein (putative c-di-GMP-specific phosphodiesterase class I)